MEQESPRSPQKTPPGAPKKRSRLEEQNQENLPTTPELPQPVQSPFDLKSPAVDTPATTPTARGAQSLFLSLVRKKSEQIKVAYVESPSASPTPTKKAKPAPEKHAARKTHAPQSYEFKSRYENITQALLHTLRTFRESPKTKWEQLHTLAQLLFRLASILHTKHEKITPEQIKKLKKLYTVLKHFIEENKVVGKYRADEVSEEQFRKNSEAFYLSLRFDKAQFDFLIKLRALILEPPHHNIGQAFEEKQKTHELLELLKHTPENFSVYFSALLLDRIQRCDNLIEAVSPIAENLERDNKNLQSDILTTEDLWKTARNTKRDLEQKSLLAESEYKKANKKSSELTLKYRKVESLLLKKELAIQKNFMDEEQRLLESEMLENSVSREWTELEERKQLANLELTEEWGRLAKQRAEEEAKLAPAIQRTKEKYAKHSQKLSALAQEISTLEEALEKTHAAADTIIQLLEVLAHGENQIEGLPPQIKIIFQRFQHTLNTNTDALNTQFNALWNNGDDIIIPDEKPTPHTPPRKVAEPVEYSSAAKKLLHDMEGFIKNMELLEDQEDDIDVAVTHPNLAEPPAPIIDEAPAHEPVVMNLYEDLRQQREILVNYARGLDRNTVEYQEADEHIANIEHAIVSALATQKQARDFINNLQKKNHENDKGKEEAYSPARAKTPSPFRIRSSGFSLRTPPTPKTVTPIRKKEGIAPLAALAQEAPIQEALVQEEVLLSFSPPRLIPVESAYASAAHASPAEKEESSRKRGRNLSLAFSSLRLEQAAQEEQEDPRYQINKVLGDGDCGYTGFGITREDAYRLLCNNTHVPEVQALLQLAMNEAHLNHEFQNYVADQRIDFDDALAVAQAFIDFDLIFKQIEDGWPHPAVLFALAHIQNIGIRIWRRDPNGELIPNRANDNYDYFEHIPAGATETIDLLYRGNNHFDRLDIQAAYLAELLFTYAAASQASAKKSRVEEKNAVEEAGAEEESISITPTQKVGSQSLEEKSPQTLFFKKPIEIDFIQKKFNILDTRLLDIIQKAHDYYEKNGVAPKDFGNTMQTIIRELNNLLEKIPGDASRIQRAARDRINLIIGLIKDVGELTVEEQIKHLYQLLCTTEEPMKVVPTRPASPTKGT